MPKRQPWIQEICYGEGLALQKNPKGGVFVAAIWEVLWVSNLQENTSPATPGSTPPFLLWGQRQIEPVENNLM